MYGPVQLTSLTAEITTGSVGATAAANDSPPAADARHFKGEFCNIYLYIYIIMFILDFLFC